MPITQEQADTAQEFHDETARPCDSKQGPVRWRRNGKTKRWKRKPFSFQIPVKFGMYSYDYITERDRDVFHVEEECPSNVA